MQPTLGYELIDFGGGARLERFGDRLIDRPRPAALEPRGTSESWRRTELRFDGDRGWTGPAAALGSWTAALDGLTVELRPTDAGQLGVFPEHLAMLPWLRERIAEAGRQGGASRRDHNVLNLFAYTGLASLALAAAGAAVTHVDSSRPTIAWARRNAGLSGLADRPIRWIVDDAVAFTEREIRRKRRYTGLVLDPPTYGHGPTGQPWRIEEDLVPLLEAGQRILEPDGFVLLTAHSPGFDGQRLAAILTKVLASSPQAVERGQLFVSTGDDRRLELGAFARWSAAAS